jgi:tRNA modification GTPase
VIEEARAPEAETIVARATGEGPAAIALLRLSGTDALQVAQSCLPALPQAPEPRRLYLSAIVEGGGEPLDEVLAVYFKAPRSYTGEDVVEISAHGGPALVEAIERRLIELGARRAQPGEYTRRAVRHGRMDLIDAEALAALLAAGSAEDLVFARAVGRDGAELRRLMAVARAALAEARGAEDHPLETAADVLNWRTACRELAACCTELARGSSMERRLLEGQRVVLLGPVNAGKSSLFNALVGERRALVDERPGTTRDAVSAPMTLGGRRITLYDTAGTREAVGVERAGIEVGLDAAREADLVIWVEDGSASPTWPAAPGVGLWVENKGDLPRGAMRDELPRDALVVSAMTGSGIDVLRGRILDRLRPASGARSLRQLRILREAAEAFGEATAGPDDWGASALERGVRKLTELVDQEEDLADEVYQRFCIGK